MIAERQTHTHAHGQTHTDRHAHHNTPLPYRASRIVSYRIANLKDVLAVLQLDESGVRLVLQSEEHFRHLDAIALPAHGRTHLAAHSDTRVSTRQSSGTRLVAARTIAGLVAQPSAAEVAADPEAWLATRVTRTAAVARTPAVITPTRPASTQVRQQVSNNNNNYYYYFFDPGTQFPRNEKITLCFIIIIIIIISFLSSSF